ncbi:MAG TPA: hypothetical protein VMS37_07245 [Verrucomicrobiae bacterium]|nr:hypothetical protein [Verrucomicrobiae bacterium]
MNLPRPPFIYEHTDAVLFLPDDPNLPAILWGVFPIAPTGPFQEVWRIRQADFGTWTVDSIRVNNPARMQAGRLFWNMPKKLSAVSIEIGETGARAVVGNAPESGSSMISTEKLPPATSGQFEMRLVMPSIAASLTFEKSSSAVEAWMADAGSRMVKGRVLHLGGRAVLSAPVPVLAAAV